MTNILLLCTDQQRFDALGASGNTEIDTPNLDRLAAQGARFENCYVQSPVCAPSRASLMTGQYVHAHGLWANCLPPMPRAQGSSLLPLATDRSAPGSRDWALCEYRNSGHPYDPAVHTTMLRHGPYKIVVWHGSPSTDRIREGELYDLDSDPRELDNLWNHPDHFATRVRLEELLLDVLVATQDRSQERGGPF